MVMMFDKSKTYKVAFPETREQGLELATAWCELEKRRYAENWSERGFLKVDERADGGYKLTPTYHKPDLLGRLDIGSYQIMVV